ncbi:MAG: hypothetical protein RLZZ117_2242 [Cyanobacteriota bacterium]|jgi:Asp-tRNA(Asn)/Glu-tRNA(Gln) amidotransferase A subunit family amidase
MPFSLEQATIPSINSDFDTGVLTSAELVQLYLKRIAAYDGPGGLNLNSIISLNPNALAQAGALDLERGTTGPRSALHGIPVLLKDNIDASFLPTTAGFLGLAGSLPPDNATIAQKLLDAGTIILGKTSLTEFPTISPMGCQRDTARSMAIHAILIIQSRSRVEMDALCSLLEAPVLAPVRQWQPTLPP